jgi:hypothetical protein
VCPTLCRTHSEGSVVLSHSGVAQVARLLRPVSRSTTLVHEGFQPELFFDDASEQLALSLCNFPLGLVPDLLTCTAFSVVKGVSFN